MESYIGLDANAASCALGVVGASGKRLGSHVVETNARALIEVLDGVRRLARSGRARRPRARCVKSGRWGGGRSG